jgi:hypothetical protein
VNGGLIDFQDNTLRGVPEYGLTPGTMFALQQQQQQQQQMQAMMNPGMMAQIQQQQGMAGLQNMQNLNNGMLLPMANPGGAGAGAGFVSGPASYYHVNGVLYAPIGDPVASAAKTVQPTTTADTERMEEAAMEEDSGERVHKQVQAYMRRKNKDPFCASSGARNTRSSKGKVAVMATAEELAAARVSSLNAAMPKGAGRVDASIRRQW